MIHWDVGRGRGYHGGGWGGRKGKGRRRKYAFRRSIHGLRYTFITSRTFARWRHVTVLFVTLSVGLQVGVEVVVGVG